MSELAVSTVRQWEVVSSYYAPKGADYSCPKCGELSHHYKTNNGNVENLNGRSISVRMACTRCEGISLLWVVGISNASGTARALHVWPNVREKIEPKTRDFSDFENGVVPEKVLKTYKDAVRAFEVGIWDGAGTLCGKTLEGAIKTRLPEGEKEIKGLGHQLNVLKQIPDLSDPFNQLTDAIRVGRNISTHFDESVEINEQTAKALIDLVEYVLEFFFVYENKAQALNHRMKAVKEVEAETTIEVETEANAENQSLASTTPALEPPQ